MLELKSADILGLVQGKQLVKSESGRSSSSLTQRSAGVVVVSTAIGAGAVYYGIKKGGGWHILTALGAINLFNNGIDIIDRVA